MHLRRVNIGSRCPRADSLEAKAKLAYDKREQGSTDRELTGDIPRLGLKKGDRLEPHQGCQDIGGEGFDLSKEFPLRVLFWRKSDETRTRHRLPLMDSSIGISIDTFMIDSLHTLYLGVAATFVSFALRRLIIVDAFRVGA